MAITQELSELITQATDQCGCDDDAVVAFVTERLTTINAGDFVERAINTAIRRLLASRRNYERHSQALAIGRTERTRNTGVRLQRGPSTGAVNAAAKDAFLSTFKIGGRAVGLLMKEEIQRLRAVEARAGEEHMANADFLDALDPLVKSGKSVAQCVTDKHAEQLFERIRELRANATRSLKVAGQSR